MNRKEDSERFDQMADFYDEYRPGYPQEIIHAIIQRAGLKAGSRLLEIGSGSGKATAQFVDNGFEITCVDPGAALVHRGNERLKGKNVSFIVSRFENYAAPWSSFDAIISAQAFHWVPQPEGYQKCAALLKEGGYLAPFWNLDIFGDTQLDRDLYELLDRYDGFVSCISKPDCEKRTASISAGILESGLFAEAQVIRAYQEISYTPKEYFGYLQTSQVFIQQSEDQKRACFSALEDLCNRYGGAITRRYMCELYLAQKLL